MGLTLIISVNLPVRLPRAGGFGKTFFNRSLMWEKPASFGTSKKKRNETDIKAIAIPTPAEWDVCIREINKKKTSKAMNVETISANTER